MKGLRATIQVCPLMSAVFLLAAMIAGGRLLFGITTGMDAMPALGYGTPWASAWAALFGASLHLYNHRNAIRRVIEEGERGNA
ncbi:hypothetical protein AWH63_10730 [Marinobacter sp. C18]|uniref:hypothetical protein n=1 Tax=Marinobacter sp. C18 TaxID=1772288 RepID=UPI000948D957|nr:hypothetical protein [Marinobacter sp. C18]OLF82005.1 hypothetical protein AWH63_10730 [Marinobacter sp. C18]